MPLFDNNFVRVEIYDQKSPSQVSAIGGQTIAQNTFIDFQVDEILDAHHELKLLPK
jgi:hypothetical protein